MRTLGLLLIGFGAGALVLPVGFVVWAHYEFSVGRLPFVWIGELSLPGAITLAVGALLVWAANRRSNSN